MSRKSAHVDAGLRRRIEADDARPSTRQITSTRWSGRCFSDRGNALGGIRHYSKSRGTPDGVPGMHLERYQSGAGKVNCSDTCVEILVTPVNMLAAAPAVKRGGFLVAPVFYRVQHVEITKRSATRYAARVYGAERPAATRRKVIE